MKLKHFLKTARFKSVALAAAAIMAGSITAAADDFKTQDVAALEVINDFLGTEGQSQLHVTVAINLSKTTDGKDKFSYNYSGSNLSIQASSGVAACRAFYDFIKSNGAGISTWAGKRFAMPASIKKASQAEYTSPYRDHQYFNVVTYGYSTPYWDEARWDKELNWMALHGIDMPLMLVGSEQIYRKVFKELYNVTDDQLNAWEVGPAHLPWMRMGNLAGNSFDGPLGDNWHNRQNQLAKHILKRMHELGMRPIVPAFGGFVPQAVATKLGNYSTTGWDWIPTSYKNYRLTPTSDGNFYNIGKKFIEEWDKEYEASYGEQFKYYLSDSFNEMKVPTDLNTLAGYGSQIYNAIKDGSGNTDAVWVTQGWEFIYGSDKWFKGSTHASMFEALVRNVPDHNFMVLSMSPEYGGYGNKKWEEYNNYGGKEWNHTLLPNMGGKNFWTGVLNDYAQRFPTTLKNSGGNANCTGWGMTMEGIEYNEMLYELIADMGWEANRTKNLNDWVQEYGNARFGNYSDELKALHNTLRNTVYTSYIDHQNFGWQGNGKTNGANKYYEGGNINTTNDTFFQGFQTFFSAENIQKLKDGGKLSDPLRADLMEFAAFYGAARISKVCTRIISLNNAGNKAQANLLIEQLDKLMYDVDYALTGHPLYDEAKWEAKAEAMGDTQDTKDKYRKNARRIVSVWYGNHTGGYEPVNDYASRIWAGLMRDYYRPRLIGELRSVVNGTSINLRDVERQFIPNGDVSTKAPALTTPKHTVNGVLTAGAGITDATSDADLLDFLKVLVDEASEIGQITIEKQKIEYSDFDENHWYYINSNNDKYLDRALTVSGATVATGDLRVNVNTGANSQIWRIIDNGDGTCRLENRNGQSFSWDGAPKTYIANIASDMVFELDEANTRYAILPQVLKGQTNCSLHFNRDNGVPEAYGYKSGTTYYGGSVWTLAKADGSIEVTSDEDRARICRRINGFKADVWGDATLYGKPGQPNDAAALETAYTALSTRDLALETYSDYLLRYNQIVAANFNVPTDAQAHKLFDLILSAFQLSPNSNPSGVDALRTALVAAQTALANGATGDAAKAQIAPLETAIKTFIMNVGEEPSTNPTATITAVFPDGTKHIVYSDGTKLTAGATVPAGGISTFEVASRNEETGAVVLKAGDKFLHMACGSDATGKMSDWDGLSESENNWTTLTIEPANATGVSLDKRNGSTTVVGSWGAPSSELYQIKGMCSDNQTHYFILRSNDIWLGANSGDRFFDSNWNGDGTLRTSFFEVQFTEAPTTEAELIDVAGLKASASLVDGKFASNTVWYTIANYKTGGNYYYMSTATTHVESPYVLKLNVTAKDETAAGQWCLVADATNGGYNFYNRALGPDYVLSTASQNGAMVAAASATSTNFSLQQGTNQAGVSGWFIKDGVAGNNYWNQQSNYLRHWNDSRAAQDNNSTFVFAAVEQGSVTPAETAFGITFSNGDDEHYYYIKSNLGDIYLADKGLDKAVRTDGLAIAPAMQWKFVGTKDNCQIVNKQGHYLWLGGTAISASGNSEGEAGSGGGNNDKPLRTQETPWADGFKLAAHATKTGCFTITPNNQANGYGFNVWGGNGTEHTIGLWSNTDNNNAFVVTPIENVKLSEYNYTAGQRPSDISDLSLWYDFPATATTSSDKWMEYGLPIGNGRIGAVLNGGVLREETQFNEKTLYDGTPTDFGSHGAYANFGWFYADDESGTFDGADLQNYTRFLDIEKGVAGVNYESASGTKYTRRYFTSAPDNVMAMRYTAEGGSDKLHLKFSLKADENIGAGSVSYADGKATFDGKGKTVSYGCQFRVAYTDGTVTTSATGIDVEGASEILVLMSGLTNCDMSQTTCVSGTKEQVVAKVNDYLDAAQTKGYEILYADHVANFSGYMDRCSLQLGNAASQKTTKDLIDYYNQSSANTTTADGLFLEQLYFQYGRYLTIACNNINTQVPANLQGIWNNNTNTNFWHSDIHADVNVQMNYWPSEITGLSEMHMPYLDNIIYLSEDARNYHRVAQTYANENMGGKTIRGWMLPTENNIYGGCSQWEWKKMKTMSAWYCSHLWQHYRYTLDKDFLKRALPAVLRAAQFVKDISNNTNNDGTVYVSDEYSPEHGPSGGHATAFAQQNAAEVVSTVIKAHEILGDDSPISNEDYQEMVEFYGKIDKGLHTESYGGNTCLKEWYDLTLNSQNDAASHRHLSHLMALYPFGQVNGFSKDADEKNLFDAAVNSLHVRNAKNVTGWSGGHKINLHARALEGNAAHDYFTEVMLKHSTRYTVEMAGFGGVYYNLWDSHSPFQIDGNFGYCAGVAEMLMQSYDGTVHLLPALPSVWAEGNVSGLKAVGNFTVDQTWAGSKLTEATVTSVKGGELKVQYGDELLTIMTYPGETYNFYFDAEGHFASYLAGATIVNVVERVNDALHGNGSLDDINAAKNAVLGISNRK